MLFTRRLFLCLFITGLYSSAYASTSLYVSAFVYTPQRWCWGYGLLVARFGALRAEPAWPRSSTPYGVPFTSGPLACPESRSYPHHHHCACITYVDRSLGRVACLAFLRSELLVQK